MGSKRTRWLVVLGALVLLWVIGTLTGPDTDDRTSGTTGSASATAAPPSSHASSAGRSSTVPRTAAPTLPPSTTLSAPGTTAPATAAPTTTAPATGPAATARWVLSGIPIKGRAPKTGYDRALFGPAWTDNVDVAGGHNGCDTRNDILRRDLTVTSVRPGTRDCVITTGILHDPYTGGRIDFVRGEATSSAVQIDHVVALSDAWQKGAQQLGPVRRRMFANDPLNLLAVDGAANSQKGAGDAATWLPRNTAFRCRYVALQTHVKARYDLWMTRAEHEAITRILGGCTDAQVGNIG